MTKRKTVTIQFEGEEPRLFHLSPTRAETFAAAMRQKGAKVSIGPFQPDEDTKAMLRRAGVDWKKL